MASSAFNCGRTTRDDTFQSSGDKGPSISTPYPPLPHQDPLRSGEEPGATGARVVEEGTKAQALIPQEGLLVPRRNVAAARRWVWEGIRCCTFSSAISSALCWDDDDDCASKPDWLPVVQSETRPRPSVEEFYQGRAMRCGCFR